MIQHDTILGIIRIGKAIACHYLTCIGVSIVILVAQDIITVGHRHLWHRTQYIGNRLGKFVVSSMIGNYTCQLLLGLHCNPWQASLGNLFKFAVAYVKIRHAVATHTPHIIGRSRSKSHQINRTAPCHLTLGKIDIESSILDSRRESISLSRIEVRNTILFLCKPRVRFGFCNLCQRHFGSAVAIAIATSIRRNRIFGTRS